MPKQPTERTAMADAVLSRFSQFLPTQLGLYFPRERWCDLEQGAKAAARELGFEDAEAGIESLMSAPLTRRQVEVLASHLTVGETYFFRGKAIFTALEEQVLPALIASRREAGRRLRIWSAACCTGEEPYSIAILLSRLIPDLKNWNVTILGTDINPHFLRKAAAGVYRDWSFRETPPWIKEKYFQRTRKGGLEILPPIKKLVTFAHLNLVEGVYPSPLNNTDAFDIIFCRNVLMYFEPEQAKNVINNLYHALIEGGYLIVSSSESSNERFSRFLTVNFPDAVLYQKTSRPSQGASVSLCRPIREEQEPWQPSWGTKSEDQQVHSWESDQQTAAKLPPSPDDQSLEPCGYKAIASLLIALAAHPDDAKAMAELARAYAGQGRLAEALVWCQKAVSVDKYHAGYRYLLATILQELDRIEEAVTTLRQALYLDPDLALAHFTLGNLALRQGRRKAAERHFENALSLLEVLPPEGSVPEADGMTARRLIDIIRTTL